MAPHPGMISAYGLKTSHRRLTANSSWPGRVGREAGSLAAAGRGRRDKGDDRHGTSGAREPGFRAGAGAREGELAARARQEGRPRGPGRGRPGRVTPAPREPAGMITGRPARNGPGTQRPAYSPGTPAAGAGALTRR